MRIEAEWAALSGHAARLVDRHLADLVREPSDRARTMSLRVGPVYANFARQRVDAAAWAHLAAMARAAGVPAGLRAMFDGAQVNASEARPALHTALRSALGQGPVVAAARAQVADALARPAALDEA